LWNRRIFQKEMILPGRAVSPKPPLLHRERTTQPVDASARRPYRSNPVCVAFWRATIGANKIPLKISLNESESIQDPQRIGHNFIGPGTLGFAFEVENQPMPQGRPGHPPQILTGNMKPSVQQRTDLGS